MTPPSWILPFKQDNVAANSPTFNGRLESKVQGSNAQNCRITAKNLCWHIVGKPPALLYLSLSHININPFTKHFSNIGYISPSYCFHPEAGVRCLLPAYFYQFVWEKASARLLCVIIDYTVRLSLKFSSHETSKPPQTLELCVILDISYSSRARVWLIVLLVIKINCFSAVELTSQLQWFDMIWCLVAVTALE